MSQYDYTKLVNSATLSEEIEASAMITIALDYIDSTDTTVSIFFKNTLSMGEQTTLDTIVADHDSSTLSDASVDTVSLNTSYENGTPIFHSTAKPLGWYSYFTGAGDMGMGNTGFGMGTKILFELEATDVSKTIDITFNEDVYIKDGHMITLDAPFGACMDVEIVHPNPLVGHLIWFAKMIPMCWTNQYQLNTKDKSFLPMGLIVRMTLRNSTTEPIAFKVQGRLELYRKSS